MYFGTTDDEMAFVRSWIGTTETDDEFNARFSRIYALIITPNFHLYRPEQSYAPQHTRESFGGVDSIGWVPGQLGMLFWSDLERRIETLNYAIEESLRSQLMSMTIDDPASIGSGGNTLSTSTNIESLTKQLREFMVWRGTKRTRITRMHRHRSGR